jgi:hypothetical protein
VFGLTSYGAGSYGAGGTAPVYKPSNADHTRNVAWSVLEATQACVLLKHGKKPRQATAEITRLACCGIPRRRARALFFSTFLLWLWMKSGVQCHMHQHRNVLLSSALLIDWRLVHAFMPMLCVCVCRHRDCMGTCMLARLHPARIVNR